MTRLQRPRLLADLGQQGPGATADTLLIRDRDLFILDRGRQALHLLTEGSDLTTVLKKGDEVDGRTVADLVALVWGQDGPLILDRDRGLFVRGPDGVWSSSELGPGGTDQPPRAMASYDGNLYLLRDQVPAILRYDKGAYDGPGRPWLDPEAENGTIRPVSLAVDGRIYLLSADGQVQRLLRGKQETSPFLVDVVPEVADPVLIFTSPEHKNLYLLDGRSRVIEVTKDGQFLRQFRAPMGFPDQRWTAFLVDDQVTRLYLGADGKVWVTEIPPVTQPRKTDG